jgi:transketolase
MALISKGAPSILSFTRQSLLYINGSNFEKSIRDGYAVLEKEGANITFVSTGSEVSLCLQAVIILRGKGLTACVVSLLCWEVFDAQDQDYRLSVIRDGVPTISVEAMSTLS